LLRDCTEGRQRFTLELSTHVTLAAAIERLLHSYPLLRRHLLTDAGELRKHVLIFHNEENASARPWSQITVSDGDRVAIVQAVSGG
jgi:sulfur carrier protein ThiS